MEFEDHEEQEEEMGLPAGYDSSLGNSSQVRMGSSGGQATAEAAHPGRKARYRECLKNHAVGIGGHALDGCGEFMAAGDEGTLDGLKCAACNCHRNFHRKEVDSSVVTPMAAGVPAAGGGEVFFHPSQVPQFTPYYRTPAGYLHVAAHHRPLALPSTSGGGHSREDQEDASNLGGSGGSVRKLVGEADTQLNRVLRLFFHFSLQAFRLLDYGSFSTFLEEGPFSTGSRKRFRTKFTPEQKDRMLELAEKLGWRIQKHDEEVVQQFCNDTGVKRHVLKVWMHNNKHTLGKKP
ncbi:hypothetical protein WN943_021745 [Citrus x changshan-huyou]